MVYILYIHTYHTNSPLHSLNSYPLLYITRTLTYGTIVPQSTSHDSSSEIVTPNGKPTPWNDPKNAVLNVPSDLDSDPSFSDDSFSDSSVSSDSRYSKKR